MEATVESMVKAGALRQLCLFHFRAGKDDADWNKTRAHALREFRSLNPDLLENLIVRCMEASDFAAEYMAANQLHEEVLALQSNLES